MNISLKLLVVLLLGSGVVGITIGYFLRWLLLLAKKGSMELTIKHKMLEAKQEASRITDEAKKTSEIILEEARAAEKRLF